jgi:hypothetical protein
MATYTDEKAIMSQNTSFWNLEQMNLSSRSPTRQCIVLRSQAVAAQNYDASCAVKAARPGTIGVLNQVYPMMKQYGQCLHFPTTDMFAV